MNLTKIKYRINGQSNPKIINFKGSGAKRNYACIHGDGSQLETVMNAIQFCFTNKTDNNFVQVQVHFSDQAGDSWIIDRNPDSKKILKNRSQIEDQPERFFSKVMKDLYGNSRFVDTLEIEDKNNEIVCFHNQEKSDLVKDQLQQPIYEIISQINLLLGSDTTQRKDQLQKIPTYLEPLYYQWKEIRQQENLWREEFKSYVKYDESYLSKLEQEIKVIDQIAVSADSLLNPAETPSMIKKKIKINEQKINKICKKYNLSGVPLADQEIKWEKILQILVRLKTWEKMQISSEKAYRRVKQKTEPVFTEYLSQVEGILQNDCQIANELDSCLDKIITNFKTSTSFSETAPPPSKKLGFISKIISSKSEPQSIETEKVDESCNKAINDSRMAVNYALARIEELHTSVGNSKDSWETIFDNINNHHEKLVAEYGKLKASWLQIAKKYGLPLDCKINELINIINNYGEISYLTQQQEQLSDKFREYKRKLKNVDRLILEWRRVSGSQKETALDTPAILLAEARAILRYSEKKKQHYRELQAAQVHIATYQRLRSLSDSRIKDIKTKWATRIKKLQLDKLSINNSQLQEVFSLIRKMISLESIVKTQNDSAKNQFIFSDLLQEAPLTIFRWNDSCLSNTSRNRFSDCLNKATATHCGLLLIQDIKLFELLGKNGITQGIIAVPETQKPAKKKDKMTIAKPKTIRSHDISAIEEKPHKQLKKDIPILSPKAKAALDIFRTPRG